MRWIMFIKTQNSNSKKENKMKKNNQIDKDNSILVSDEWYQLYTMQREDNVKLAKKLLRIQLDHDI